MIHSQSEIRIGRQGGSQLYKGAPHEDEAAGPALLSLGPSESGGTAYESSLPKNARKVGSMSVPLVHNGAMASQVIMKASGHSAPEFFMVDNPENRKPASFEDRNANIRIPRFGSHDLAGLAAIATSLGFEIEEFEIVDSSMNALPEKQQRKVSKRLRKALTQGGGTEVVRVLLDEYPTFRIDGIDVLTKDHSSFVLRRNGVAVVEAGVSPREFLASAWTLMHFA
jgi:hypothetical protein